VSSELRIPRLATAVLVLGGACGDEEEKRSSPEGIDISQARQNEVAAAFCAQLRACGHDIETDFNLAECTTSYVDELKEYSRGDDDCLDAALDYYECYAAIDCDLNTDEVVERTEHCGEVSAIGERCRTEDDA
jgi:hypothetical protein